MQIRNLSVSDYGEADGLMATLHQIHVAGRPDLYVPIDHIYSEQKFREMVESEEYITLGATDNDRLVGLCIAQVRRRSFMVEQCNVYVDDLIVDHAYRRQGVATALLAECQHLATLCGAKRMDLMVWDFNKEALAFYEAQGMKIQRCILEKNI